MSASANPDIIDDGLVFLYDTDDGKSYKGEPTTNLLSSPTDMEGSGWSLGNIASQITITGNQSDPFGQNNAILFGVASDGGNYPHIRQIDKITGTTSSHTISIWAKSKSGSTRFDLVCFRSSPWGTAFSKTVTLTSEWQRFELTGNPLDTTGHRVYFMCQNVSSGTATEVYMAYPQLEAKSHATPFVDGTRSSTQGLLDRTGSSTIDISNASFDSNAQMTFDGTDDYFEISDPNVSSSDGFSIELIIKPDNPTSSPAVIVPNSGGIDHWLRFDGNGRLYIRMIPAANSGGQNFRTSTQLSSGNYHHVVFTFKQSEGGKAYYNGALETSAAATLTALDWSSIWRIGQRGNNTWFFEGELPVLKVYNRALTAAEVRQNFNATKSRFGL